MRSLVVLFPQEKGDPSTVQDLINRQAEWSEEVNDFEAAADMYLKVPTRSGRSSASFAPVRCLVFLPPRRGGL